MFGFIEVYIIALCLRAVVPAPENCDSGSKTVPIEGNIGEVGTFPWAGVLRVHLHDGDSLRIALTGLVLIKENYALANAKDVTKIPRHVFLEDSRAMFIPTDGKPWYCRPKDYMTHPEYEYSTYTTIAVVELLREDGEEAPFSPICWPRYQVKLNYSYAVGFTDENQLLEKFFYKLEHVGKQMCDEFYNRAGLEEKKLLPTTYQCGFARNNKDNCVWENGVIIVTNNTGRWNLVGFGVHGPGCAAPSRFIDIFRYLPWIETATSMREIPDYRKKVKGQDISVHELFKMRTDSDESVNEEVKPSKPVLYDNYLFDLEGNKVVAIDRIDPGAINIQTFDERYENKSGDCSLFRALVYKEHTKLEAPISQIAVAAYKISLYDLFVHNYTCVNVKIEGTDHRDPAYLWFRTFITDESKPETPDEILKSYAIPVRQSEETTTTEQGALWKPGRNLKPIYITDTADYDNISNVNILVKFRFQNVATLKLEVFGPPIKPTPTPPTVRRKATTTEQVSAKRKFWGDSFLKKGETPKVELDDVFVSLCGTSKSNLLVMLLLLCFSI